MKFSLASLAAMAAIFGSSLALPTSNVNLHGKESMESGKRSIQAQGGFTAYYNNDCSDGGGDAIGFTTNNCIKTTDRHAFKVTGCTATVLLWDQEGCKGTYKQVTVNPNQCFAVNTGLSWGSAGVQCA